MDADGEVPHLEERCAGGGGGEVGEAPGGAPHQPAGLGVGGQGEVRHEDPPLPPGAAVVHHHQRIFVSSSPENLSQCLSGINNSFFVRPSLES